jgi:hypothetical protein
MELASSGLSMELARLSRAGLISHLQWRLHLGDVPFNHCVIQSEPLVPLHVMCGGVLTVVL